MTATQALEALRRFGLEIVTAGDQGHLVSFGAGRPAKWMNDEQVIQEADILLNY
jgi:hypothetical protein